MDTLDSERIKELFDKNITGDGGKSKMESVIADIAGKDPAILAQGLTGLVILAGVFGYKYRDLAISVDSVMSEQIAGLEMVIKKASALKETFTSDSGLPDPCLAKVQIDELISALGARIEKCQENIERMKSERSFIDDLGFESKGKPNL